MIGDGGENLGEMDTKKALDLAYQKNLDLVVIVENAKPPVAKILDFSKFLYEERKKNSASKAKSKKSELKEFRFGPSIGEGDLNQRIERSRNFLKDGHRVRLTVRMRGREQVFPERAFEKIEIVQKALEDIAKIETKPKRLGNRVVATFVRKS